MKVVNIQNDGYDGNESAMEVQIRFQAEESSGWMGPEAEKWFLALANTWFTIAASQTPPLAADVVIDFLEKLAVLMGIPIEDITTLPR